MSKLKEDELLGELAYAFACSTISEQAYKQIVALIKKPKVTEEWIEEKAKIVCDTIRLHPRLTMKTAKDFIRSLVEKIQGI